MPLPVRPFSAVCGAAFLSFGTGAAAESYDARFDLRVSGVRAGEVVLEGQQADGRYAATAKVSSAGLVGVFTDFYFDGEAAGRLDDGGKVVPAEFNSHSKSTRAERVTRIDWEGGTPVAVSVEPPRSSAPDPAAQTGTLDPVSATFAVLRDAPEEEVCNKTVEIFDGSRRSRISLGVPQDTGDDLICAGSFARIEGEAHDMSPEREYGFRVVFRKAGDGLAQLQRVETKTSFGPAVLERK